MRVRGRGSGPGALVEREGPPVLANWVGLTRDTRTQVYGTCCTQEVSTNNVGPYW